MSGAYDRERQEDIARLAARVAMLAADDGEAENAGRAVGRLARRLGLSGGDLRQMVLDGAAAAARRAQAEAGESCRPLAAEATAKEERLAAENSALRRRLAALQQGRRRMRFAAAAGVLAVAVLALALAIGPSRAPLTPVTAARRGTARRMVPVRAGGARLRRAPLESARIIAVLPPGQQVWVRRLLWQDLWQWAEVELPGGQIGYVLTTEIDLS